MTPFPPFARRRNKDSSIDSICTKCFLTVASVPNESDNLAHQESQHICDPFGEFSSAFPDLEIRADWVRPRHLHLDAD